MNALTVPCGASMASTFMPMHYPIRTVSFTLTGIRLIKDKLHFANPHASCIFVVMFKAGQKVVCVKDAFDAIQKSTIPNLPKRDISYRVRDAFQVNRNGTASGIWALHLTEIRNPMLPHPSGLGTFEPSFAASRFATVVDDEEAVAKEVEEMLKELVEEEELQLS